MRNCLSIFKREFAAYFNAATAYIYLIIFLAMTSGLFMSNFFVSGQADMRKFFAMLPFFLLVFIPAVSMRLWSEDRKIGTIALLLSLPMSGSSLVLGKYFACLLFYAVALLCTATIPVMIAIIANPDIGVFIGAYVGSLLLGGLFLAIGIFISAFFKDQIITLVVSVLACFVIYMVGTDFVVTFIDGWINGLGTFLQNGLGAANHFEKFARGLIDLKGLVYFVAVITILLTMNTFTVESRLRMRPGGRYAAAVILLMCIGVALNLVMSKIEAGRLDLTEDKIYTISKESRRILNRLTTPIEVNYYVSPRDKLPSAMKNLQQDVKNKLADLKTLNDNFTYNIYNPFADVTKLDELEKKGIVPFQAKSIEKDSLGIKKVYSAITISYLDKKTEVIPRIVPQGLGQLEYQLLSKIYRMTLAEKPIVAMMAPVEPVPEKYQDPRMREFMLKMGQKIPEETDNFSSVMDLLRKEGYGVGRIELTKREDIPDEAATLLILDPRSLDERQIYEISRYLASGGNVILSAQRFRFQYRPGRAGAIEVIPKYAPGNVDDLISRYGLALHPEMLMDTSSQVINIQVPKKLSGAMQALVDVAVKFPFQILVPSENLNQELPITNRIGSLFYIWGGAVTIDEKFIEENRFTLETVFTSSPESWLVPFQHKPLIPSQMDPEENEMKGPLPLAVRLTGQFPDLYAGKPIPLWPKEKEEQPDDQTIEIAQPVEKSQGSLVVIGCADMFTNQAVALLNNASFLLNTVDSLTLGDDLIAIRSKNQAARLLPKISPGENLFYRFFTTILTPLLLVIICTTRLMLRRRGRERYLKMVSEKG